MQKKIFCFIVVAFLLFLFYRIASPALAADNTILFGPVELKEPINFASQAELEITVQTQNPDGEYTFNSKKDGGCTLFRAPWTPGPCIGEQKLAADPAGGTTQVKIINATRIFKGIIDDSARLSLEKPAQAEWDLKAGDKTGWVTYQWETVIGTPTIEVSSSEITTADKITITVTLTAPLAPSYAVLITPFNKTNPQIVYISINCNTATKTCNVLNNSIKKAENVIHDQGATRLSFDISGSNPWLDVNSAYAVKVTSPLIPVAQTDKNQVTFLVKGASSAAPAPPTGTAPQDAASAPAPPTNIAPQNVAPAAAEESKIPGLSDIFKANPAPQFKNLGGLVSGLLNIVFFIAIFLAFYFLVWGALSYIMAQGKKENLAKARARITWAIIGLMVTLLAFFIAKFISESFTPGKGGVPF